MKKIVFSILFFSMIFGYCVTFEVDISNAEIPDGNYIVLMNGSWNGWNWGYELTETDNSDIYTGTFCGFNKPHPHLPNSTIRIAFKETTDKNTVITYLINAAKININLFEKLLPQFGEILPSEAAALQSIPIA